jgi:hypothetical protein
MLWGDSHAAHYFQVMLPSVSRLGLRLRNLAVSSCPPVMDRLSLFTDASRLRDCEQSHKIAWPRVRDADFVILGAAWDTYFGRSPSFEAELERTLRILTASGKTVLLLGQVPMLRGVDGDCPKKAISYPGLSCEPKTLPRVHAVSLANGRLNALAKRLGKVAYIDVTDYLCDADMCRAGVQGGFSMYYDSWHLSAEGGRQLGIKLLSAGLTMDQLWGDESDGSDREVPSAIAKNASDTSQ